VPPTAQTNGVVRYANPADDDRSVAAQHWRAPEGIADVIGPDSIPVRTDARRDRWAHRVHHMEGGVSSGRVVGAVWRWGVVGGLWWRLARRPGRCRVSRLWSASYAGAGYPKTFCSSHGPPSSVEHGPVWGAAHMHFAGVVVREAGRLGSPRQPPRVVGLVRLWWSASAGWGVPV